MPFKDVMNIMLPQQDGKLPHVTGNYGDIRANGKIHFAIDSNYQGGQTGINMNNPTIHAPINGTVTFVGGQYGTIKIRDANGNSHEILHTNSQNVAKGQSVNAGDPIGSMGGTGPKGANEYQQHVHYQMKGPKGNPIDPKDWWDNDGRSSARADWQNLYLGILQSIKQARDNISNRNAKK